MPGGPESYVDVLVRELVRRYPLPWKTDQDWTCEVHDANGRCFLKFRTCAAADALIAHAERLAAEDEEGKKQVDALLRDAGIDPLE